MSDGKVETISTTTMTWNPADSEGEHSITYCGKQERDKPDRFWVACMCGWQSPDRQWPSEAHVDAMKHLGRRA